MTQLVQRQRRQPNPFTMRHGHVYGRSNWTLGHRSRLQDLKSPQPAQQLALASALATLTDVERRLTDLEDDLKQQVQTWEWYPLVQSLRALRGVDWLTAVPVLVEIGDLRRFRSPSRFTAYLGITPSESSSGGRRHTGYGTNRERERMSGFYAVNFPLAILAALPSIDGFGFIIYVPGEHRREYSSTCDLPIVSREEFDRIRSRSDEIVWTQYHLLYRNCQDWATVVVRENQ